MWHPKLEMQTACSSLHLSSRHPIMNLNLRAYREKERDITTNPEWERLYQYEIPVLAKVLPDGTEEILPRLSPRLTVELIQKKVSSVFDQ
ncbi:hypothetical protein TRIUR3_07480 [Triticum urartu]|uniref:Glutaredoxin-like protein n=2 Tax=Triticum TaxID=4564 RepID=A0A9R1B3F0_TRITD|nr:hypothetical protein TRIUR3_07480 [Triticum urartu]VAI49980.1 unnamed protein product [Triticum turgidum subsp. durum]